MTLMFAVSFDRADWEWTPKVYRTPWQWGCAWLVFEFRVAR